MRTDTNDQQPAKSHKTVRECVYDVMRAFQGDTLFGNPGSTELPMFRDFPEDFRYVLGLQEATVVGMADGFAQARRKLAFVNLHSAAGVGNAMGNIYTAWKNRTPMVIIAGQQSRSILPFDPYLASEGATELPKPYVKWSVEPARAADVPLAVAQACYRALQEPCGPVLVSVPSDDWDDLAEPVAVRTISRSVRPCAEGLAEILQAINGSAKPAFVLGAEVDVTGAWAEVVQLAERHRASVFAAPMSARGTFPEDHPLFMGFLPAAREHIVKKLQNHDVVFVIGAPVFTYHVEGEGVHAPQSSRVYQLTADSTSAARAALGTTVVGNVRLGLKELLQSAEKPQREAPTLRPKPPTAEPSSPISVAYLLQTLAALRDPEDVIVEEAPTARVVMHEYLPILRPNTFFTMSSGGLGFGMPAAAGIAMAQPDRKVIAIIGDGSSMYSIQTLWTAVQFDLNAVFIVVNNHRYGAMKRFGGVLGFPPSAELPGTDLPGLDFVALATGHGCKGRLVKHAAEVDEALREALSAKGPRVIEVIVA